MRQCRLAQARQVFDQQMAIGEQRNEGQPHFMRLAEHQRIHLRLRAREGFGQPSDSIGRVRGMADIARSVSDRG
jgi:hypothetical protein